MQTPTPISDAVSVAGQIDRTDIAALAAQGFRTVINNRPDGEEPGQLSAAAARAEAEARGLAYFHIPVTTPTISRAEVEAFAKVLATSAKPVVAHCRSGTRSYLLWCAVRALAGTPIASLVAEATAKGYDLRGLPNLVAKLEHEPR